MRRLFIALVLVAVVLALTVVAVMGWSPFTSDEPAPGGGTPVSEISEDGAAPVEASTVPEGAQRATIDYVHDGDTVFLRDGRKVRLLGINTPEVGENLECFGDEAREELRSLLPEGMDVWTVADVEPLDQYGRSLLFIYLDDGTNVNLELVRSGAAEVVQYDPNYLLQGELRAAEDAAYAEGAGLWGSC